MNRLPTEKDIKKLSDSDLEELKKLCQAKMSEIKERGKRPISGINNDVGSRNSIMTLGSQANINHQCAPFQKCIDMVDAEIADRKQREKNRKSDIEFLPQYDPDLD